MWPRTNNQFAYLRWEIRHLNGNECLFLLSIQIVPQAAAMSDRADKMKMVSKLPTTTGKFVCDRWILQIEVGFL